MKKTLIAIALGLTSTFALADNGQMKMNHGEMDHANMDHSGMNNAMMNMEGMSEVGMPAKGAKPDKVVHVILDDEMSIKFKKAVEIEPNDVVQFVVMNVGKIDHEFTIGSANEQLEHREMMKNMGSHAHDSDNAVTVKPGKAKQILWHFHGSNQVEFACNITGHAEAGMVKKITL